MSPNGQMLSELSALISAGQAKPVIDSVFPLEQVAAAYVRMATAHAVDKTVLDVK
jgi:NADPH:quinone reductase-like Zn-dependent oxidoreductase